GVAVAALLFALHKTRTAADLARAIEEAQQKQARTAATMRYALEHCALARGERDRAVAAEGLARRRFARLRELARAVLFDLPDRLGEPSGPGRAFLVQTVLAYLDALAEESGDDDLLRRELAVGYARLGDLQGGSIHQTEGDRAAALASHRKSLLLFE